MCECVCVYISLKPVFNDLSLKAHLSCRYQQSTNVQTSGWSHTQRERHTHTRAQLLSLARGRVLASALTDAAHTPTHTNADTHTHTHTHTTASGKTLEKDLG